MRIFIILFAVGLVMAPVIYVLFFTSFLDRLFVRLSLDRLSRTAKDVGEAADYQTRILQRQKEFADKAMRQLEHIPRTRRGVLYVIAHSSIENLYWSNTEGWCFLEHTTRFAASEKKSVLLPREGYWTKEPTEKQN